MIICGKEYTKKDILARVGNLTQFAGIKRYVLTESFENGCEIIEVSTGGGLKFKVSPNKGMDIVAADYCGSALNWHGVNGVVHPSFHKANEQGWLDSTSSGLLTTCGLSNVGSACVDEGKSYGLHGEIHNICAKEVTATSKWVDDECYFTISGIVEEHKMFGHYLVLSRTITAQMGINMITVRDEVTNLGDVSVPLMLLYHCNFGFPLLGENTRIILPSTTSVPREEGLEPAPAIWRKPQLDFSEQVYLHSGIQSENNIASAIILNPEFPVGESSVELGMRMQWDVRNLPILTEWYMPGCSTHALGIEPANCNVFGRAYAREHGLLKTIAPGENKEYNLNFSVFVR